MIITKYYDTREDGVKLYRTVDVVVDEDGEPILDENEQFIPTGFKIHKVGTNQIYDDAIDVAGATFVYETTDIPIAPKPEEPELLEAEEPT